MKDAAFVFLTVGLLLFSGCSSRTQLRSPDGDVVNNNATGGHPDIGGGGGDGAGGVADVGMGGHAGAPQSDGDPGLDGGGGGDAGLFIPAPFPPGNPCDLLSLADVQKILPMAGNGEVVDPLTPTPSSPYWIVGCKWLGLASGTYVDLTLAGALTMEGNAALDVDVDFTADGSTDSMAVSGVGSNAEYVNHSGRSQFLGARVGSYLVSITVYSVIPDVPEESLQSLIVKVIGEI